MINEPNFEAAESFDAETGLWLDRWQGDPYTRDKGGYEYGDAYYTKGRYPYYPDPQSGGECSVRRAVGGCRLLRLFKNPLFDAGRQETLAGELEE